PFDVLLYTPREWEQLTADASTFASRIIQEGTIVYG
ncbi:MAG TPA: nucleotidyltransferase domain-containing protein, partial [Clostridiales bacterium]|nr:nucleotidyltransferase domain-containing protein [Clostridiales bacterium]